MNGLTKLVAAVCASGVVIAGTVAANAVGHTKIPNSKGVVRDGHALSFDFGGRQAVTYFTRAGDTCEVTVVVTDVAGDSEEAAPDDSAATRYSAAVGAGNTMTLDTSKGHIAVLSCSADAQSLSLEMFNQSPYKS